MRDMRKYPHGGVSGTMTIPDEIVDELAGRIAAKLASPGSSNERAGWIGTKDAAAYLGMSATALHKLTSSRGVPFVQDVDGGKCWFRRSDLDAWRLR